MSASQEADPEMGLSPVHQDLYDHLRYVLDRHLSVLRKSPMSEDLMAEAMGAYDVLDALVEDLKIPQYDLTTAHGRLMDAVAKLNQSMPGVALRTLGAVHHYLVTSDDDGIATRQKAMAIIQGVGLTKDQQRLGTEMISTFPPLP